ncbi:MAG: class I SAM-dependent methyltransferase [Promethearchaeota archaeon]|nr:MAG: class I SAM-dependent methyltransferase [Candidatus Lokiarchaeota archaeon]
MFSTKKIFYDHHVNFSERSLIDYEISPGTNAKFNLIKKQLGKRQFNRAIDIGCSGNSVLPFLDNIHQRFYLDIARNPLNQFSHVQANFPLVSVLEKMALKQESFDLVTALDVLEHVKDDTGAIQEIYRILKPGGILLLYVPHRMKFYSYQDMIIGHYSRYELQGLRNLVELHNMEYLRYFGIYGQAMRVQLFQAANPEQTERKLLELRNNYTENPVFRKIWKKVIKFGKFWMTLDAKFQPLPQIMNIGVIFQKKNPPFI